MAALGYCTTGSRQYPLAVLDLREANAQDSRFLAEMLAVAADWRPDAPQRTAEAILRLPEFAHYIAEWPRPGDRGVIAEVGHPVGAAWFRLLPVADKGYGFVADDVPEITIGVRPGHRGSGIGTALLSHLVQQARDANLRAVSLSVEDGNPAIRMYARAGFVEVDHDEGAATMLLLLQ